MAGSTTAVFGLYETRTQAEQSLERLRAGGFSDEHISVVLPDVPNSMDAEKSTKAPEGIGATGGAIGGTMSVLAGIGALTIPGIGLVIAAGPIVAAGLAGLAVGGTVGGFIGTLVGIGVPKQEAERYEGHLKKGGVLLSVHCNTPEQIMRTTELLKHTGAQDISSVGESSGDRPATRTVSV